MALIFLLINLLQLLYSPSKTQTLLLSGSGNNHTVPWEFYCTSGRNSGVWTTIPVPSNWELQGFGTYNYGHDLNKADEKGLYKHRFIVPQDWKGNFVEIVFEGSMTDTEVKINGKPAGPVHQGGFYRFSYPVSNLLNYGKENLLEVTVSKVSSDPSVNSAERDADYWVFGGIFRPVYLRCKPEEHIERIAIDAKADGSFKAWTYTSVLRKVNQVSVSIYDLNGQAVSEEKFYSLKKDIRKHTVHLRLENPKLWDPENPNLYYASFTLWNGNSPIHTHRERFGFRTIEVRLRDGIYCNDKKIMFKGVCRHSFWPASGRTTSKELSIADVNLMKDMNMNAVRMSHYPPDVHFLEVCDSLGLFVLDELAGWQKPPYDTLIGKKLVEEMVARDVNHPCIVLWDNGNEGGWNTALDDQFDLYDPQKRKVVHPWEIFNGMDTQHYRDWNYGHNTHFNGNEIFFPTEFLHGLYDGGHGAGLDDFWNLMLQKPLSAGGFLWVFSDEGVVRTDLDGIIDTRGNLAPDGILGPFREKEGSFYTIREIWSPVYFEMEKIPPAFDGKMKVHNRYFFTNLNECSFRIGLLKFDLEANLTDSIFSIVIPQEIKPGEQAYINANLPGNWREYHALSIEAKDKTGRLIHHRSWPVIQAEEFAGSLIRSGNLKSPSMTANAGHYILEANKTRYYISRTSGLIDSVISGNNKSAFGNGPVLLHDSVQLNSVTFRQQGSHALITATFSKGYNSVIYDLHPDGWMEITCKFDLYGEYDYAGIGFSLPEKSIRTTRMLARGPYRVWKNRMKGNTFGLWNKHYNNTVTGESWDYPEYKGYYADFYALRFDSDGIPLYITTATEDLFLKLYNPDPPAGARNSNTTPHMPPGDIAFLNAISPIGTKFRTADRTGPQGWKNQVFPHAVPKQKEVKLFLFFGEPGS